MAELEPFPGFVSIGFHTQRILNRLQNAARLAEIEKDGDQNTNPDANQGDNTKQHPDERARYVEQRLREIAIFEESASGKRRIRTKLR